MFSFKFILSQKRCLAYRKVAAVLIGIIAITAIGSLRAATTINILETGSSLLYPLFNLWIPVFSQTNPNVRITTASTGSGTGISQAIEGIAQAANVLGIPVVSGNVSLYNDADGFSIPPTPVVGCIGLVPNVRKVPARWQSGDVVLLATSPDGSLESEAALVRFLWKAAPHLSLCHDVGSSGIDAALAEAAAWSGGLDSEVEIPPSYDARRGAAILACRPERVNHLGSRGFVEIGKVQ